MLFLSVGNKAYNSIIVELRRCLLILDLYVTMEINICDYYKL